MCAYRNTDIQTCTHAHIHTDIQTGIQTDVQIHGEHILCRDAHLPAWAPCCMENTFYADTYTYRYMENTFYADTYTYRYMKNTFYAEMPIYPRGREDSRI